MRSKSPMQASCREASDEPSDPSRNLAHIATDPNGTMSAARLQVDEKVVFNPTDSARYDGFPDHVCRSIQYPNARYFRKARNDESLFADWVVLLIKPDALWADGTKFCERNAAAKRGTGVKEGEEAFKSFKSPGVSAYNKTFTRTATHPWTDQQAEVPIPDHIARRDILGVAVADEPQAKRKISRLKQLKVVISPVIIAPDFFQPDRLRSKLLSGRLPTEIPFPLWRQL
ncbi:MAG: DUF4433 domain-containing protein [Polyangiaceae bacterium]|nr:DUF4433 domain-containing protein [Polyangiaceae bacterium]